MSAVWRTVYLSKAVGGAGRTLQSVVEILGESQRNNTRDGLTGLLLAHDGWFLQVLEGDRGRIDHLLARLSRDRRHTDIRILSAEPVAARSFGDWSMGQILISPQLQADLAGRRLEGLQALEAEALLERSASRMRASEAA